MKNVLCFGDSNTWGYIPLTGKRFPPRVRWTGVLRNSLGAGYWIIEEGLNGRTTVHNEEERPHRSGRDLLPVILESHMPINLLILMLGTNDLKARFHRTPFEIAMDIKSICESALEFASQNKSKMKILLVCPPSLNNMPKEDAALFSDAMEKSSKLMNHYAPIADSLGIDFFDAGKVVKTNTLDGVHWDAAQHEEFGKALSRRIPTMLE